jgi:hypothetical protein
VRPARRAGDLAGAPIQRTPAVAETAHAGQDDEEVVARRIEATILHGALGGADGPSSASSAGVVDAEALTDRVYCRLVDELLVERERAAWLA